jgi:hypothetical protein
MPGGFGDPSYYDGLPPAIPARCLKLDDVPQNRKRGGATDARTDKKQEGRKVARAPTFEDVVRSSVDVPHLEEAVVARRVAVKDWAGKGLRCKVLAIVDAERHLLVGGGDHHLVVQPVGRLACRYRGFASTFSRCS